MLLSGGAAKAAPFQNSRICFKAQSFEALLLFLAEDLIEITAEIFKRFAVMNHGKEERDGSAAERGGRRRIGRELRRNAGQDLLLGFEFRELLF